VTFFSILAGVVGLRVDLMERANEGKLATKELERNWGFAVVDMRLGERCKKGHKAGRLLVASRTAQRCTAADSTLDATIRSDFFGTERGVLSSDDADNKEGNDGRLVRPVV
jgi:hypothetical protein